MQTTPTTAAAPAEAMPVPSPAREPASSHRLFVATTVTGTMFIVEALASVVVDSHLGYHGPNTLLNAGLLVAALIFMRHGRRIVGVAGVVGGAITAFAASLALCGGIIVLAAEGVGSGTVGDAIEGIAHTAVLLSMLALVPLGLGVRRIVRSAGIVIAASAAVLVAMVLAGFDQPAMFVAPEAALGLGWLLAARSFRARGPID